jgi:hypothetical protein
LVLFVLCEVAIWTSTEIDSRLTWWSSLEGAGGWANASKKAGKFKKEKSEEKSSLIALMLLVQAILISSIRIDYVAS